MTMNAGGPQQTAAQRGGELLKDKPLPETQQDRCVGIFAQALTSALLRHLHSQHGRLLLDSSRLRMALAFIRPAMSKLCVHQPVSARMAFSLGLCKVLTSRLACL